MKVYPDGERAAPWLTAGEDVTLTDVLDRIPCQICGHPDGHHGFGRSCWNCPGGACQPRIHCKGRA